MLKRKNSEQTKIWSVIKVSGMSVFALVAAFVAIVAVNYAGMATLEKSSGALNAEGIPLTFWSQLLVLLMAFSAGALGAFFLVWLAPVKPKVHALIYLFLITLIDVVAMVDFWGKVPVWFSVMMIIIVPLQVWAGMKPGLKIRRKRGLPKV